MAHRAPERGLPWWRVALACVLTGAVTVVLAWLLFQFLLTRG